MPPSPFDQVIQLLLNLNLPGNFQRRNQALLLRLSTALAQWLKFSFVHPNNGDEEKYQDRNYIGSYTKALRHNTILNQPTTGEVDTTAYRQYLKALQIGTLAALDLIPLGGTAKLANPLAAYAFELEGADSHGLTMPAAPNLDSKQEISEIAELYWQALTRDVPFSEYDSNPLTSAAATDLSQFSDFRAPKDSSGQVSTRTLFRGGLPGDLNGPYISQFLWVAIPNGVGAGMTPVPCLEQRSQFPLVGQDFMTDYQEWLQIQNGQSPSQKTQLEPEPRYIRTSRDLAEFVHRDYPYQAFVNACLILLSYGPDALDPANPYWRARTQTGFVTFGASDILDLVARVANEALKAAWYQKWLVHRRLRPEEFGGWLENQRQGLASYPFNPQERPKLDSVLNQVLEQYGSYLLPQAFPEGCPTHPAYPAGHATYAGACVTVLKALFNEDFTYSLDPNDASRPMVMEVNDNGTALQPYPGPDILTVGGELNKLAANIAIGRDAAGVHWRTDSTEGLVLGEQVAICLLQDRVQTYKEDFPRYTLTKFNNQKIRINKDGTITNL
jgi:membrane-associated phospholipid phosphatase